MNEPISIEKEITEPGHVHDCCQNHTQRVLAIRDAVELLGGKWKIQIIGTLLFRGKRRFMDLLREVDGIAAKMLSKELQDLEVNQLIKRTVLNTKPVTVEYEITEYGKSLEPLLRTLVDWGVEHRKRIMTRGNQN
ncbi:MAG: helix-turn-helix transcriptional regulator [Saprospiraceae bacterium]|nr:helix-turn-helix transcriptional regulator [Saprospiraceae bacterium]